MPLPRELTVQYGDIALLIGKDRRTFLRTITQGQRLECHLGYIEYDALVGQPYGAQVPTHLGHKLFVLQPNTDDIIRHLQREGQIIFPKDLGYIALKLGIQPGAHVLEAGTGSGALLLTLAMLVGDEGHVYSYERRAKMQERALNNLRRMGWLHRATLHQRDIERGFDERDLNAVFLDVREPWTYLAQAREALRGGGFFGAIVPTINQVTTLTEHLYAGPWFMLEIEEILLRTYKTIPARIRPDEQMVGHTGYLVFARAVDREPAPLPGSEQAPDDESADGEPPDDAAPEANDD